MKINQDILIKEQDKGNCSSRYQDPCLLGICSREKSKNCQNSPVVEKSDETGVSVCILWGEKEEVGGRGSGVADLPSSGA